MPVFDVVINGSGTGVAASNFQIDGGSFGIGFPGFGSVLSVVIPPGSAGTLLSGGPDASVAGIINLVDSSAALIATCPAVTFALNPSIPDPNLNL